MRETKMTWKPYFSGFPFLHSFLSLPKKSTINVENEVKSQQRKKQNETRGTSDETSWSQMLITLKMLRKERENTKIGKGGEDEEKRKKAKIQRVNQPIDSWTSSIIIAIGFEVKDKVSQESW